MSKKDTKELIRRELRSGRKSPSELKSAIVGKGKSGSTYDRHRKKMVERGEVRRVVYYELAFVDFDRQDIDDLIKDIDAAINKKDWKKCEVPIKHLRNLCRKNRVGELPDLLDAISKYAQNRCLIDENDIRYELALTMQFIMRKEKASGSLESFRRVKDAFTSPMIDIARSFDQRSRRRAIEFLCEIDHEPLIDLIFEILLNPAEEIDKNSEDLIYYVLFESNLARMKFRTIQSRLGELAGDPDEIIRNRARQLLDRSP